MTDLRPVVYQQDRNDVEATHLLFDALFRKIAPGDPAHLLQFVRGDCALRRAELEVLPRLDLAEDQVIAVHGEDVNLADKGFTVPTDNFESMEFKKMCSDLLAVKADELIVARM
ncbi:MAG: hypothetical protein WB699_06730 [Bacteroidota bacterium]